jgi:hypothetical protein
MCPSREIRRVRGDFDYGTLPQCARNVASRLAGCNGDTFILLRGAAEEVWVVEG